MILFGACSDRMFTKRAVARYTVWEEYLKPSARALAAVLIALTTLYSPVRSQSTSPPPAGTEIGFGLFQRRCMTCHGNPNVERAPSPAAIREMPPEKIYDALTS